MEAEVVPLPPGEASRGHLSTGEDRGCSRSKRVSNSSLPAVVRETDGGRMHAIIPGVPPAFPVFDAHIHVGPYDQMNEGARRVMLVGRDDLDLLERVVCSADELLKVMDAEGIARVALSTPRLPRSSGSRTS